MFKFAFFILFILILMALIGPFLRPYSYADIHLDWRNAPPSLQFWFGTDELGRDLFTRVCWGARISLFIGVAAAMIDLFIGALWGSIAAYKGGKTEEILMRICDILYAIPHLLIAILLIAIWGPGIGPLLIAMTVTGWINMARICRAQVLSLKQTEYVFAAKALGAPPSRILFRHLIPNAIGPLIAAVTLTVPKAIFSEGFLSFLGLGIQMPAASLGSLINDGIGAMRYYPWRLFFPALVITLIMLSFHLLSSALREPKTPC